MASEQSPCETCDHKKRAEDEADEAAIVMCFDVTTFKRDKSNIKFEILENVCGLRNARGGKLFIHLKNHGTDNFYHGWLDECIDNPLNTMIADGSMFTDVYKKTWGPTADATHHDGFLCITVKSANVVVTGDFNTHIQTDHELISPSPFSVFYFLKEEKKFTEKIPEPKGREVKSFQEGRNIQFKSIHDEGDEQRRREKKQEGQVVALPIDVICKRLIGKCNLKGYISAFAKQESGGHFYLGVQESIKENRCTVTISGFQITGTYADPKAQLTEMIENELDEHLSIYDYKGNKKYFMKPSTYLYNVKLHNTGNGSLFLEIPVSPYPGLVFETKSGPFSFLFNSENNKVERCQTAIWFKRIKDDYKNILP